MLQDIITAIVNYFRALSYISKRGFKRYFFMSGLIGLSILAIGVALVSGFYDTLAGMLLSIIPWDFAWLQSLSSFISATGIGVVFLVIYKHLVLIFTAPIMSKLSEKVELEINEEPDLGSGSAIDFLKEIGRGIRISLRNIFRELFYTISLFILGLIPGLSIITAPMIVAVQGYYAGFGNFDFWAERHFSYRGTIRFMKDHKPMVATNGAIFVFILAIPIIGAFLAPPLATIASTIHGNDKLKSM